MSCNKLDKIHIELYSIDGVFQGYLKSVSIYHQKVSSTNSKLDAKSYAKLETASKDCSLVGIITKGGLIAKTV